MLKRERQSIILHEVNLHNKVLSVDLSKRINVSDDTIRRDLNELAKSGKVVKVHGGALSPSFYNSHSTSSSIYAYEEKKIIAQKAVQLIKDGMFVHSSGGTTIIEMAKALPHHLQATFVSGSIPVLAEYILHPNIEVIVIGDKVSKNSMITVGHTAISKIHEIKADLCFLGVNAISPEAGVSDNDWEVAQIKKAIIESSDKQVCLTISEKLNSRQPVHICGLDKVDILITELPPHHEKLKQYVEAGITVL